MSQEKNMKGSVNSFAKDMKKLVNNKDMSDIKFLIGPNRKTFYAHRCVLSSRCEVFRAMFVDQKSLSPKEIPDVPLVLSDMSPDVFMALLEYLYTNCVTLNNKTAIEVLSCSMEYGLEELRKLCQDFLIESLNSNNICEVLQAAVTFGQNDLRTKSLEFIDSQAPSILKSKAFAELSDDAVAVALMSDNLQMDEMEVVAVIRDWANVNSIALGQSVSQVAKRVARHIRLPLLSPDELTHVEKENQKDQLIPVDHMSYAWKVHALKKGDRNDPLCRARKGTIVRECHKYLE